MHTVEASGLGRFMREALWAYPAAETVHIVGIGLLFGSIAIVDLRLLGLGRRLPVSALAGFAAVAGLSAAGFSAAGADFDSDLDEPCG